MKSVLQVPYTNTSGRLTIKNKRMKKRRKAGGGRKKLPPELVKQTITVFIEKKFVDAAGGPDMLKAFLYEQALLNSRLNDQVTQAPQKNKQGS